MTSLITKKKSKKFILIVLLITSLILGSEYLYKDQYQEGVHINTAKDIDADLNKPKSYEILLNRIRTREDQQYPTYESNYIQKAIEKGVERNLNRSVTTYDWQERGPSNVGGRVRDVAIDYRDDVEGRSLYVGSAGGGVWYTQDFGETWQNLSEDFDCLSTTTLGTSPANPNRIYAGTGEKSFALSAIYGCGIYRSDDGGKTWIHLNSTKNEHPFGMISDIYVDPKNADNLYVGTYDIYPNKDEKNAKLLVSNNAGKTWTTVLHSNALFDQIITHPDRFDLVFTSVRQDGIYKYDRKTKSLEGLYNTYINNSFRTEMAMSPVDPNYIYIQMQGLDDITRHEFTTDGGKSWNQLESTSFPITDILGDQGYWNNAIAAHPTDVNRFFVGGTSLVADLRLNKTNKVNGYLKEYKLGQYMLTFRGNPFDTRVSIAGSIPFFSGQKKPKKFREITITYDQTKPQKAHFFKFNQNNETYSYTGMYEVSFQAHDQNGNQVAVAILDLDNNRKWDYLYNSDIAIDEQNIDPVIFFDKEYYNGSTITTIKNDPRDDAMYVISMAALELLGSKKDVLTITGDTKRVYSTTGSEIIVDGYNNYSSTVDKSKGVHVDHHFIKILPKSNGNFWILNANDGGFAISKDKGRNFKQTGDYNLASKEVSYTKSSFLSGLNITQFYDVSKMPGKNRYAMGSQDNGSYISSDDPLKGDAWDFATPGDGFNNLWHATNPQKILVTSQNNFVRRSLNQGSSWTSAYVKGKEGPFFTQIINSRQKPDRVFCTTPDGVAISDNFGQSWRVTKMSDSWSYNDTKVPIDVSDVISDIVWTGADMSNDGGYHIMLSRDGGRTFSKTNNYPGFLGPVSGIFAHPTDPASCFLLFSFDDSPKVLKTADYGTTWEDISGFDGSGDRGFPNVSCYSLAAMPFNPDIIWVGTDIGLVTSEDGGKSWHVDNSGLPNVAIWDIEVQDDQIMIATHGRGLFTLEASEVDKPVNSVDLVDIGVNTSVYPSLLSSGQELNIIVTGDKIKDCVIQLVDMTGKIVSQEEYQLPLTRNEMSMSVSHLNPGVYFIQILSQGRQDVHKIVIQ